MKADKTKLWLEVIKSELIPALGCTEPIAIAYAAALAREILGQRPEHILLRASNNIIKNVKSVIVPNSGGRRGLSVATCLGALAGDAGAKLEVLQTADPEVLPLVDEFIDQGKVEVEQMQTDHPLHIIVRASAGQESAEVEICDQHTRVVSLRKNGLELSRQDLPQGLKSVLAETADACPSDSSSDLEQGLGINDQEPFFETSFAEILDFIETCQIDLFKPYLEFQYKCNLQIAEAGLEGEWGQQLGRHILPKTEDMPRDLYLKLKAKAYASAGSDARMAGCTMPVVITAGSGNHGLTVSLPVWVYAEADQVGEERMLRALLLSNLLALYQKAYIGRLSAFCGITSAGAAAVAAIAWLEGEPSQVISAIISNSLAGVSGMVCDGAKEACAFKISASLGAAFTAWDLARDGHCFKPGDGIIKADVDSTIRAVGEMAKEGMLLTDEKIVQIMIRD